MPFAYSDKAQPVRVARFIRGECGICHKMIKPGEAYEAGVGGTNTQNSYLAHYNCYKPASAPSWGELNTHQRDVLRGIGK